MGSPSSGLVVLSKSYKHLMISSAKMGHTHKKHQMANPTRKYLAGAGEFKEVGYNHLISNQREWNNCFFKNPSKLWKSRLK